MPNWCNNNIVMTGPTDKLQVLMASPDAFLDAMVPMPKTTQKGPIDVTSNTKSDDFNWYDWRIDNWGTKWEVDTEGLELTDNGDGTSTIHGYFDSAWSPPIEAFATYGDNNPEIEYILDYLEEGMCFVGRFTSEGDNRHYSYSDYTSKTIGDYIHDDILDEWDLVERMAECEKDCEDDE
jgi:hypothetical protein